MNQLDRLKRFFFGEDITNTSPRLKPSSWQRQKLLFYKIFVLSAGLVVIANGIYYFYHYQFKPGTSQANPNSTVTTATPSVTPTPSLTPISSPTGEISIHVPADRMITDLTLEENQQRAKNFYETQSVGALIKYALYTLWGLTVAAFLSWILALVLQWRDKPDRQRDPTREMLEKFHKQALQELQRNSRAGLFVSFLGIAVIFTGIFLGYLGNVPLGVITASSGTVVEGVSFLFHNQTKHIRRRVEALEDKLHRLVLVEGIEDEHTADEAKKLLATGNMGRQRLKP